MVSYFANKLNSIKTWKNRKRRFFDLLLASPIEKNYHRVPIFVYVIVSSITVYSFLSYKNIIFIPYYNLFFTLNIISSIIILFIPKKKYYNSSFARHFWSFFLVYLIFMGNFLMITSNFHHVLNIVFLLNLLLAFTFIKINIFLIILLLSSLGNIVLIYTISSKPIYEFLTRKFSFEYFGLLISTCCCMLVRNRTLILKFFKSKNIILESKNQKVSEELLKALHLQKRFVDALDSECIDAFITLHQIGEDLQEQMSRAKDYDSMKKVNEKVFKILDQNEFVANYLLQIIYKVKDHLKLNVEFVDIKYFLSSIRLMLSKTIISLKNNPKIFVQNESTYDEIECDLVKICSIIEDSVKFIYNNCQTKNLITITLCDAKLDYKISFMKDYIRRIDAIKIVISNDVSYLDSRRIYGGNYEISTVILPRNLDELSNQFNRHILDAHYGFMETKYDEDILTQIYVIPKKLRQVRPKVMDL